nr:integrase, catalytic region, zinc finger, CCHC-type, peptidase aspartic, catalytic [Tanacetum cinerariifolium]
MIHLIGRSRLIKEHWIGHEETLTLAEESRSKMIEKQKDPKMAEKKVIIKPIDYTVLNQLSKDFETRFVSQTELSAEQAFCTTIVEVLKELLKASLVNSSLKKLKFHLASFDMVVKERTTATVITEGTWRFEHTKACFRDDIIPFVKVLKELFNSFDQFLIDELSEVQNVFKQMELDVEQNCEEKHKFQNKIENVLQENDRLLTQALSVDIVNIIVHDNMKSACLNVDVCERCVTIKSKLKKDFVKKDCYEKLFQKYNTLEKHCISLEVNNQLKKEISQINTLFSPESAPTFVELFEINDLKAQAQANDTVILKLREKPHNLNDDVNERKVKREVEEIKTLNIKLDHKSLGKILGDNSSQRNYKQSQRQKVVTEAISLNPIDPELLKIDVAPLAPKLRKNRTTHTDYIRHTQEEAATLREIVESERLLNPLNTSLDYTYRSQLVNFVQKFLGTVKFGNDHVAKIMGYGDYQIGNVTISRVYYVEGLGHNLFSVGQFCDSDLEGLVRGLPKLKFEKDHLCSSCAMGKSTKKTHKPKSEDTNQEKLYLLHMDLCGPMRIESVNGKKYILVIVDDYSRFTWVKLLRSKDETSDFIIKFLKMIQVRLKVPVCHIQTDNGTEFVNQTLRDYYEEVAISHETSVARSSQQNGVVERRNRTLIEAARTMLIYAEALLFLWAEAVATACFTQNRSIIRL